MESNVDALNWSSGTVLVLGWVLALGILFLLLQLIKSTRHGGTVSSISIPGLFVTLGLFCIATPKINSFILQYGENRLKVGKLEKEIKEKQTELAAIESELRERQTAANEIRDVSGAVAAAKTSKKDVFSSDGLIVITYPAIAAALKQKYGKRSEYWIFQKSKVGNGLASEATVVDEETGDKRTIMLEPNQQTAIEALVKKGN
jgi:hypothetical protein